MSRSPTTTLTKLLYSVGVGLSVSVISGISYWLYKVWKQDVMPQKWRRIGTLAQINIFPIKSGARLELDPEAEVVCEVLGLRTMSFRDRCLMVIDENDKMLTARAHPKMLLIESKIESSTELVITAPGMSSALELNFEALLEQTPGKNVLTSVWGSNLDALLCGEKYDTWFSTYILEKPNGLRLVFYPHEKPVRSVTARMVKEPFITREDTGTFGDATSYMLMNLASIADLNTRLSEPVHPLQFRGNFHLKMDVDEPYAEDNWQWIKIGEEAVFRNVSNCTRCILPNINPFNGIRNPDCQPLKTLQKYRKWEKYGSSPVLGIHLGLRQHGSIKPNDIIYVEDNQN